MRLRRLHHLALNVKDLAASRRFYGEILGLEELQGEGVPATVQELVAGGQAALFVLPDGLILDLFAEPRLDPPHPDPHQPFTRVNHLAFDIAPLEFDQAVARLHTYQVPLDHGPVTRPTGSGIYVFDPDGLIVEIRCDAPPDPSILPVDSMSSMSVQAIRV